MDTDLRSVVYSKQPLTEEHCQYFTYQLLRGLKYLHTAGLVHMDLKPHSLLINADCSLVISGLAQARALRECLPDPDEQPVARWYRAPERHLRCSAYDASAGMWSVGCVLAELLGRKPLFPHSSVHDQLRHVVRTLGSPTLAELESMTGPTHEQARQYVLSLPPAARVDWRECFPAATPLSVALLDRLLQFDPRKRIDVHGALKHPWLEELHDEAFEPAAPEAVVFEVDWETWTTRELRRQLFDEAMACSRILS